MNAKKEAKRPRASHTFELKGHVAGVHQEMDATGVRSLIHAKVGERLLDVHFPSPGDPAKTGLRCGAAVKIIVIVQ